MLKLRPEFTSKGKELDGSLVRYSQCWEDADLLVKNMEVRDVDFIVCIASAGDNSLSLLAGGPQRLVALDFCPAQLALVALKVAAFKTLEYDDLLAFLGARPASAETRLELYGRVAPAMGAYRHYFDRRPELIGPGVINCGKLDQYFAIFRKFVLPLVHSRETVRRLFAKRSQWQRLVFFNEVWNNPAYRLAFQLFFNSITMAVLGREAQFFNEAKNSLAAFLHRASKAALVDADPSENCYLHYILTGRYDHLPHYLRRENYAAIKANLDKLVLVQSDLASYLDSLPPGSVDGFNLSDVFEYMPAERAAALASSIRRVSRGGARLVYWNMLVDREISKYNQAVSSVISYSTDLPLHSRTFFYSRFSKDIVLSEAQ